MDIKALVNKDGKLVAVVNGPPEFVGSFIKEDTKSVTIDTNLALKHLNPDSLPYLVEFK